MDWSQFAERQVSASRATRAISNSAIATAHRLPVDGKGLLIGADGVNFNCAGVQGKYQNIAASRIGPSESLFAKRRTFPFLDSEEK
jgi:hypothetical protein